MGIGCPNALSSKQSDTSLPVLNMIVLGFPKSGKSALISRLGLVHEERLEQNCSIERVHLEIGSFVLEKRVKILAFEAPSGAVKTWRYYYVNAHIILFVVDRHMLKSQGSTHFQAILSALEEIDRAAPAWCQLIVVFSKSDLSEGGEDEAQIIRKLQFLRHETVTIKSSALSGQGIDKISHTVLAFHNTVNI